MKNYQLSIITENQKHSKKAGEIADLIKLTLRIKSDPEIRKYEKFANSYIIDFKGKFNSNSNFISKAVELTDRLASPWMVDYNRTTGGIGLIFNKSIHCRYGRKEFNVIRWANLETE